MTLDDDVAHLLEEEARRRHATFKAVVNDAIRRGLAPGAERRAPAYRVRPHKTTLCPGVDPGAFNKLVDELEDEAIIAKVRSGR
ncbi:MAG: hypothetical protein U0359_37055 [Byssovorax sp.]